MEEFEMKPVQGLYQVLHEQYATDRYVYGLTIVKADSKEEAMEKLNDYLSTKPDGAYTALFCESIDNVSELYVLH